MYLSCNKLHIGFSSSRLIWSKIFTWLLPIGTKWWWPGPCVQLHSLQYIPRPWSRCRASCCN